MNKFFLTTVLVLICAGILLGQGYPLDERSKIVGGQFMFTSLGGDLYANSDDDRLNIIEFDPYLKYFIAPGIAVGGQLIFQNVSQGSGSTTTFGIGPEATFYVGGEEDKSLYPFASVAFFYINNSFGSGSNDFSTTQTKIRFSGGILQILNAHVGITGQLIYDIDSIDPENGSSVDGNQFGAMAGFSIFLN